MSTRENRFRDPRSDNQANLHHMYSMIAVKARIPPPTVDHFTPVDLEQVPISTFLCHYAALCLEFTDAWKHGDGERITSCWRVFLLHFCANGRTKYALEALTLQFQLATLSPSLVHQLTWGRFVNTHGGRGRNIPCDLFNEHVNRLFKDAVQKMGANFTEKATTRVARSISQLQKLSDDFDVQTGVSQPTIAHTTKDDKDDVHHIATIVLKNKLLDTVAG